MDDPEASTTVPETPVLAPFVPELSNNEPLEPAVLASAETISNMPLEAVPVPVTIRTSPPLALDIVVPPDDKLKWPSDALLVDPTTTLMLPASPLVVVPTPMTMLPAAPDFVDPVLSVMEPDAPALVDSPDRRSKLPVEPVALPVDRTIPPLVPIAPLPPTPEAIVTPPVAPLVEVPELSSTAPVGPTVSAFADRMVTAPVVPKELPLRSIMMPPV